MGNCGAKTNYPRSVEPMPFSDDQIEQNELLDNQSPDPPASIGSGNPPPSDWAGGVMASPYNGGQPNNVMIMPMQVHSPMMMPSSSLPQMNHNPIYEMPSVPLPPPVESFSHSVPAPIEVGSRAPSMSRHQSMSYEGLHPYYQDTNLSTVHYPETQNGLYAGPPATHTELAPGVYKDLGSGEIIWDNEYYDNVGQFLHLLQEEDQFALTRGRTGRRMSAEELAHVPARAASVVNSVAPSQMSNSKWPAPPPRPRGQEPEAMVQPPMQPAMVPPPVPSKVMEHRIPQSPPHEPAPIPQPEADLDGLAEEDPDETTTDDEYLQRRKTQGNAPNTEDEDTTDYESVGHRRSEPQKKRKVKRRRRRKASTPWRGIFSRSSRS